MFKVQRSKVLLKDIKIYAYHGVLPQERVVGANFILNITIDTDFSKAMETDDLKGTISYAEVYDVVKAEMAVPPMGADCAGAGVCVEVNRLTR